MSEFVYDDIDLELRTQHMLLGYFEATYAPTSDLQQAMLAKQ